MKKYTITGVTGYIGSKLLEQLSQDENAIIYAIIRKGSKPKLLKENIYYISYDGTEKSLEYALSTSDYLVHLAALYTTSSEPEQTIDLIQSNILFSTQLFNVANKYNKNLVIASASTFSSLNGEGEYAPATLYAATKRAVEDIAHYYKDLSIHFLTLPDTFGEDDWRPKIHNLLAKNTNWPFEFRSSASQEIRLLHVEDVIGHLLSSLEDTSQGVHIHDIYAEGILLTLERLSKAITSEPCLFNESSNIVEIPHTARNSSEPTGYKNKHKVFYV